MNKKKTVTLLDIAKELKVSKVTVSKALRDHPDISAERKRIVKDKAKEMEYFPNFAARNLSAKKSNTIGVIVPAIANSFFAQVIEAIYNYAFEHDYEIILAISQEDSEKERKYLETMLSMKVDGIITSVSMHSKNIDMFRKIKSINIPLVFFDRILNMKGISSVTVNNELGAYQAITHAIKTRYKKIGFLAGFDDINIGKERMIGFEKAMNENKIKIKKDWVVNCGYSKEEGYNGFYELYNKGKLPQLIFAVTFPVALGAYCAAEELGLTIPDDFDIICFGNSKINKYLKPSITCIDQDASEVGINSLKLIFEMIAKGKGFKPQKIKIEPKLKIKDTCH